MNGRNDDRSLDTTARDPLLATTTEADCLTTHRSSHELSGAPPVVRYPLEQFSRLNVECGAQPVERIGRKAPEGHVRVGQSVSGGNGESRFLRETIRCPTLPLQNGGEMKANHRRERQRTMLITGDIITRTVISFDNSNTCY
jgi:hypothetical protein